MRKEQIYLFTLILSGILFGCKDEYDSTSHLQPSLTGKYLRVSQTNFNHLTSDAFTDNFKVEASETSWKFTTIPTWLSISPSSGSSSSNIVMEGSENTSGDARTSIFYLESGDTDWNYSKAMSVSQGGVDVSLTVEPTELSFIGSGETKQVLIIANCEWTAKCSQDWITLYVMDNSELSVTAAPNPTESYRESVIYITYGDNRTANISVTQFPANISSSETTLKYDNNAGKYEIKISSEIDWTAEASESWIMVDPKEGNSGETLISIEVTPNTSIESRTGYVAFKTGDYERFQIAIEQDGLYIESVNELSFRSIENSLTIEIKSNTDWEILSSPEWLSFSKTSGNGNAEITVTANDNPNSSSRSGTITIGQKGLSLEWKISVTQSGRTLEAGTTLLEFSDKKGSQSFELTSDGSWTSICSENWFSATPVSGSGDSTITVNVEENTDDFEREGTITYTFGNRSMKVVIQQSGKYFNLGDETFEFSSQGGSHIIELSTNEKWTAQIVDNVNWLSLSSTSGEGESEITLTVQDNPSVNSRSAEVIISPENLQAIRIKVTQAARYLKVSTESIMFYSDGGTSQVVSIDTDGTYKIESNSDWFKINKNESSFTVTAEAYKQPETRKGLITISLTDLEEGSYSLEIPVIQIGEGCSFIVDGYTQDEDWNDFGDSTLTFTITGYTTDQNWNTQYESTITINISGYSSDKNWD